MLPRCFVQTMHPLNFTCGKDTQRGAFSKVMAEACRQTETREYVIAACPSLSLHDIHMPLLFSPVGRQTCNAPSGIANALEPACEEARGLLRGMPLGKFTWAAAYGDIVAS